MGELKPESSNIVEMVHEIPFNTHQQMTFSGAQIKVLQAKARLGECYVALEDAQRDVRLAEENLNAVCGGVVNAAQQIGNWEPSPDGKGMRRQAKKEG
jgi:outer membrane protein TolC